MRTFVAVELDHAARTPLVRLRQEHLPRTREVRWCTEDQLHITLKFLGEVAEDQLASVAAVMADACRQVAPFEVTLGKLGQYPPRGRPRVLWCGIDDPERGCARWVARADPGFEELGFPPEQRAFMPHVTLGRAKSPAGGRVLSEQLERLAALPPRVSRVERVTLFESRLKPSGAEYHVVCTVPLGAHGAGDTFQL